jgi:hypothetical protein
MWNGQSVRDHCRASLFTGQHFIGQAVTSWQLVALDYSRYQRTYNLISRHVATMRQDILNFEECRQMYLIRFHADYYIFFSRLLQLKREIRTTTHNIL